MKSVFFALPLLAALASARAVAGSGSDNAVACATAFSKCVESAVASGSVQGLKCAELKGMSKHAAVLSTTQLTTLIEACAAAILPRSAAPPTPEIPGLDISKIIEAIEKVLGQNSTVDTKALATQIHNDISANGFDIGSLINAIINAFDGKAGGVDVGKIINEIIKAIGGIAGDVGSSSALGGQIDAGAITNIIMSSIEGPGLPDFDIGAIVKEILAAIGSGGKFEIGKFVNTIIHLFNGKTGGIDVGKIVNSIVRLIISSGIFARDEQVNAASLLDIPKLINTIIQIVGDGKNIDVGKLVQAIVSLIGEVVGGIGGIIPGGLSVNAHANVHGNVKAAALPFDFSQLINGILELISGGGGFDIGKLIELIMKLVGSIPKPGQ
ncbi:hypothetical protein FQN49_005691 [Arthroderma sp. PD_2]|nr:hypothetical protein FQN49_005691 [Arthroderma sp. PD_2]